MAGAAHLDALGVERARLPRLGTQWAGLALPPVGWGLQLLGYSLTVLACHGEATRTVLHASSAFGFLCAIAGGIFAIYGWFICSRLDASQNPQVGRARLMAGVGIMNALLFAIVTTAQFIAIIFLDACPR